MNHWTKQLCCLYCTDLSNGLHLSCCWLVWGTVDHFWTLCQTITLKDWTISPVCSIPGGRSLFSTEQHVLLSSFHIASSTWLSPLHWPLSATIPNHLCYTTYSLGLCFHKCYYVLFQTCVFHMYLLLLLRDLRRHCERTYCSRVKIFILAGFISKKKKK